MVQITPGVRDRRSRARALRPGGSSSGPAIGIQPLDVIRETGGSAPEGWQSRVASRPPQARVGYERIGPPTYAFRSPWRRMPTHPPRLGKSRVQLPRPAGSQTGRRDMYRLADRIEPAPLPNPTRSSNRSSMSTSIRRRCSHPRSGPFNRIFDNTFRRHRQMELKPSSVSRR